MKPTFLACFLAASLLACDDDAELDTVNTLGTDVQFSMTEYLEPGQRTLSFKFLTTESYPCINYRIASELRREGSDITVSLREIQGADVCLEALAPAVSFLDVGELPPGEYPFTIEVGTSITNRGTLLVTEEAIELLMAPTEGFIVPTSRLMRVPEGVIWGSVQSSDKSGGAQAQVIQRLRRLGASAKVLSEGNYGYFSVDVVGNVTASSPTAAPDELFVLGYRGEASNLKQLIDEMTDAYDQQVSVSVRTSGGHEFRSAARD
jgi:hypothetical protein